MMFIYAGSVVRYVGLSFGISSLIMNGKAQVIQLQKPRARGLSAELPSAETPASAKETQGESPSGVLWLMDTRFPSLIAGMRLLHIHQPLPVHLGSACLSDEMRCSKAEFLLTSQTRNS